MIIKFPKFGEVLEVYEMYMRCMRRRGEHDNNEEK